MVNELSKTETYQIKDAIKIGKKIEPMVKFI